MYIFFEYFFRSLYNKINDQDDDENAANIYRKGESKGFKLTKIFFCYGCCQVLTFTTALFRAIFDICNGKTDTSAWKLPTNITLPFDTQSVYGWLLNWFLQINVGIAYSLSIILISTHFACFCFYIVATCKNFDLLIDSLHIDIEQIQQEKNTQKHPKMWQNAKEKLQQAIEMHITIYE